MILPDGSRLTPRNRIVSIGDVIYNPPAGMIGHRVSTTLRGRRRTFPVLGMIYSKPFEVRIDQWSFNGEGSPCPAIAQQDTDSGVVVFFGGYLAPELGTIAMAADKPSGGRVFRREMLSAEEYAELGKDDLD